MVSDDIKPFIGVLVATGRLIHRTARIDLIIDHDLLQMHEAVVLIDPDGDPDLTQR